MSKRVMKGFLVLAVVVLMGFTVIMRRHENAQIAEDQKTLVAPDPQKIERLVDGTEFDIEVNDNEKKISG